MSAGNYLANIYLFKFNNKNTSKKSEIRSKLPIKTPERRTRTTPMAFSSQRLLGKTFNLLKFNNILFLKFQSNKLYPFKIYSLLINMYKEIKHETTIL